MQNDPSGANGKAMPKRPSRDELQSAIGTIADLLDAAYDLITQNITYEGPSRASASIPSVTANQITSILRAGREFARTESGLEAGR